MLRLNTTSSFCVTFIVIEFKGARYITYNLYNQTLMHCRCLHCFKCCVNPAEESFKRGGLNEMRIYAIIRFTCIRKLRFQTIFPPFIRCLGSETSKVICTSIRAVNAMLSVIQYLRKQRKPQSK